MANSNEVSLSERIEKDRNVYTAEKKNSWHIFTLDGVVTVG
jgi:hypothetical protein